MFELIAAIRVFEVLCESIEALALTVIAVVVVLEYRRGRK